MLCAALLTGTSRQAGLMGATLTAQRHPAPLSLTTPTLQPLEAARRPARPLTSLRTTAHLPRCAGCCLLASPRQQTAPETARGSTFVQAHSLISTCVSTVEGSNWTLGNN